MDPKRVQNISHLDGHYPFFETIVHFHNYVRYKSCTRGGSEIALVSLVYLLD
jgi:hypothetical protein